ncbi:MEKHLA domain-containing protein [Sulfuriroseicoccus oceanibius]|uniref:MEKHLA domain-containing protein n=1 Tax=Sulfuriroseicoccus oceanibius TaxID=2707525 RepID=A0A6B3LEX0_9BACT|nr:MEKHLA domain-containing protein [Sulfuriroseicoccus oceanibius]QQL45200.1 MEKHLA domain-containing protein [Sulfuriroseicoccus oceanibius]
MTATPSSANQFHTNHIQNLVRSFKELTGRDLIDPSLSPEEAARWLFEEAPFMVASHDGGGDPVLTYGNRTALELFEMTWDEFTSTPSRFTAEPPNRDERAELLRQVTENGFIDNYSGIRISKTGRRFRIQRATVWNVTDTNGNPAGQAATFSNWEWL